MRLWTSLLCGMLAVSHVSSFLDPGATITRSPLRKRVSRSSQAAQHAFGTSMMSDARFERTNPSQRPSVAGVSDPRALQAVLRELGTSGKWREVLPALSDARSQGTLPDMNNYNTAVFILAKFTQIDLMEEVLALAREDDITPNGNMYNSVIPAYSRAGHWQKGVDLLAEVRTQGNLRLNGFAINSVIQSLGKAGRYITARELLRDMKEVHGITPDEYTYSAAINACANAQPPQWQTALSLLDEVCTRYAKPHTSCFSAAARACGRAGEWERAESILNIMKDAGIQPDAYSYNAVISALGKAEPSQWQKALGLLDDMRAAGMTLNEYTFGAALEVCAAAVPVQWQRALQLCNEMRATGLLPDLYSLCAVMKACEKANKPAEGVAMLRDLRESGVPCDELFYEALVSIGKRQGSDSTTDA